MEFWIKAAQLVLSLAFLVTLHELGHFIPAKLFKTRVEKFYLFFNPWFSLFRFKKVKGNKKYSWLSKKSPKEWDEDQNTTEWGLGWLPLGGYVKIAGMIDESMDKEQMEKPAEPWEFRSKKAWQRLIIMIGGVTVNLFLGFIIYIGVVFSFGKEQVKMDELNHGLAIHPYLEKYNLNSGDNVLEVDGQKVFHINDINKELLLRDAKVLKVADNETGEIKTISFPDNIGKVLFIEGAYPPVTLRHSALVVDSVMPETPASKCGLKKGDKITAINNESIEYFDQILKHTFFNKGKKIVLTVVRLEDTLTLNPVVSQEATIGFRPVEAKLLDSAAVFIKDYGFSESIGVGLNLGYNTLLDYVSQFKFLFTKKGASSMGGFAAIGNMFPPVWDWESFWLTTAFLSIILAFMNILPIPALDGGHVVFLIYEMITGKEAPKKVLEYAQMVGMVLLLSLVLYANFNDLYRWLF